MKGKLKKFKDREIMEFGDFKYTIYFKSKFLTSGIAIIASKGKGDIDKGHKDAEEVFTVCKGKIRIIFPDSNEKYELDMGDSLLIPPGESHIVENNEIIDATVIFTAAPKL